MLQGGHVIEGVDDSHNRGIDRGKRIRQRLSGFSSSDEHDKVPRAGPHRIYRDLRRPARFKRSTKRLHD